MFINDQDQFDRWLSQFSPSFYVGIDTEFVRRDTFFPILSLIQISSLQETVVIDPLAVNIIPLLEKISDESLLKIFFSGRQDVEAIFYRYGVLLHPIFDLQIACDFLNYRESVSFSEVVLEICHEVIDKDLQKIDWHRRPLSADEVKYAYNDAFYLMPLFKELKRKLKECNRYNWALEESSKILDQVMDCGRVYFEKKIYNPCAKYSTLQQEMVLWREQYARLKNIPRRSIFSDIFIHETKPQKLLWKPQISSDVFYFLSMTHSGLLKKRMSQLFKIAKKNNIPRRYFNHPYEIIHWLYFPFVKNIFMEGWRWSILENENFGRIQEESK